MKRFLFPLVAVLSLAIVPIATAAPPPIPDQVEQVALGDYLSPPATLAQPVLAAVHQAPVLAALDFGHLFSSDNIAWAIGALLSFLLGMGGVSKWLTANRRKWIGFAAHHAFLIVEDLKSNGVAISDKVIAGLSAADDWLAANGFRTLSPQEKEAVRLQFKALNGSTVVAAVPPVPSAR